MDDEEHGWWDYEPPAWVSIVVLLVIYVGLLLIARQSLVQ